MMQIIDSEVSRRSFLSDQNLTYYKLVGGLGNQLFGLSRAYLLHKESKRRIAIDVSSLDHTPDSGPEWKNWDALQGWSELITSPRRLPPPRVLTNLLNAQDEDIHKSTFFTGWRLSLEEVFSSGLFIPGEMPFSIPKASEIKVGVHIRGGDYRKAPGIGLLSKAYYKRALQELQVATGGEITIFSDDLEYASKITKNLSSQSQLNFSNVKSPLSLLAEMSASETFIGSNSTLSWWASFFSKSSRISLPRPMYLQDWFADREIHLDKVQYIDRFSNPIGRGCSFLKWRYTSN
jgi:hypothetical protein